MRLSFGDLTGAWVAELMVDVLENVSVPMRTESGRAKGVREWCKLRE